MPMPKVGFRQGLIHDPHRRNWTDDGPRPVRWSAWYPAVRAAVARTIALPPGRPTFIMGTVARDAMLQTGGQGLPVVLLSHGTGGTASSLGWLAQGLAAAGAVVIGVDHHGNTASEPYRAEGFLCWWERAADLSLALDALARQEGFSGYLDTSRVSCAGFSLGGHTALSLLGATVDMHRFEAWIASQPLARGPREFPDLADHIGPLLRDSAVFRASWDRQSASCRDPRVRAAVVLAPPPTVRGFVPDSLRTLGAPVTLMVGGADRHAPAESCAAWLHDRLPDSRLHFLDRDVGHYTLLCPGTDDGREREPELYRDAAGIDRRQVHREVLRVSLAALGLCEGPGPPWA